MGSEIITYCNSIRCSIKSHCARYRQQTITDTNHYRNLIEFAEISKIADNTSIRCNFYIGKYNA